MKDVAGRSVQMRLSLVVNRRSGGYLKTFRRSGLEAVLAILRSAGHDVQVHVCGRDLIAQTLYDCAQDPNIEGVIVGGGDGTIRTAILAGLGRHKPLGILPLGSLNLLARDLGIPLDPLVAAQRLAPMAETHIDLAEVNGLPFAIWASLGLHPLIIHRRDKMQRGGMGHWYAFLWASLQVFSRYAPLKITAVIDGERREFTSPIIVISNNAWRDKGQPFSPLIRDSLDHNELVVHVVRPSSRLSLVWMAINALLGRWKIQGLLDSFAAREVWVSGLRHRIMVSLDGEVVTMHSPLCFTCKHKELKVVVPQDNAYAEHRPHL